MNHSFGLSFGVLSRNHDDFEHHAGILVAIRIFRIPSSLSMAKRSRADTMEKVASSSKLAGRAQPLE